MDGFPQNEHGTRDLKAVACKPKGALGAITTPSAPPPSAPLANFPPLSKNVKKCPVLRFFEKVRNG